MLDDRERLTCYRRDIQRTTPNARVLEIGPGPAAVLTRMCLDAGAGSIISVEGDGWVAAEAERVLRRQPGAAQRCKLINKLSTQLEPADVAGDLAFDVLVCEIYDSIGCREQVVETIADLRSRGFTFRSVISRGFETWVAPCAGPPARAISRLERLALGWGFGTESATQGMLDSHRSTLHGDHALIERLCLAPSQRWQAADFEADGAASVACVLRFTLEDPAAQRGFLFWNRFLFHGGHCLSTLTAPTNWGVTFVPLPVGMSSAERELELHTHVPNAARPSVFSLQARTATRESQAVCF